jgi:hypothetical protein
MTGDKRSVTNGRVDGWAVSLTQTDTTYRSLARSDGASLTVGSPAGMQAWGVRRPKETQGQGCPLIVVSSAESRPCSPAAHVSFKHLDQSVLVAFDCVPNFAERSLPVSEVKLHTPIDKTRERG